MEIKVIIKWDTECRQNRVKKGALEKKYKTES